MEKKMIGYRALCNAARKNGLTSYQSMIEMAAEMARVSSLHPDDVFDLCQKFFPLLAKEKDWKGELDGEFDDTIFFPFCDDVAVELGIDENGSLVVGRDRIEDDCT